MQTGQTIAAPVAAPRYLGHLVTLDQVILAATLSLILFCNPSTMADPDIWWHLRNAEELVAHHTFLTHDLYSFTAPGTPWLNHEWLAELPFYLGWRVAGASGVFAVSAVLLELIFAGVFLLARRASSSSAVAAVATVGAAILATVSFGPRTLLFGWVCLVAELLILTASAQRPARLLLLPPLFAFWINLHGSWLIGLVVLAAYAVGAEIDLDCGWIQQSRQSSSARRPLRLSTALSAAALFLNPYGWRLVAYPFNLAYAQKLNVANVQEWQALDWHSLRGRLLCLIVGALAIRQLSRPRRWNLTELTLLLIATYSAVTYSRFLFLFAILVTPIAARSFAQDDSRRGQNPDRTLVNIGFLLILCLLCMRHLVRQSRTHELAGFPTAALAHLPQNQGPVFNEFLWGGYLIWNEPRIPVFIDSRVDLFEANGTFKDYLDIIHLQNTLALLDRHRIRYVFFEPDTPLVYLLRQTGSWHILYQDQTAVLLERNAGPAPQCFGMDTRVH